MTSEYSKRDLIIQAGLEAIPYVGGSLSTLYFGAKQDKRFERLEKFYSELKSEIESTNHVLHDVKEHNNEDLESLLEQVNEKVEVETREQKIKYLKNFFLSTIEFPINNDFDQRKYFLDILGSMSLLECEILGLLYKCKAQVQIRQINRPDTDQYAIYSAINKLRSYGFLESRRGSYQLNGQQDENLDDIVFVSGFGKQFCEYIKIA